MRTTLTLIACIAFGAAFSQQEEGKQTGAEKRGEKLFDDYNYSASIEALEQVKKKDVDILRELAVSYDMVGDYFSAETYYAQVCSKSDRIPEDYLEYARILMKNEKYSEAELQIKNYAELNPGNAEAARFALLNESVNRFTQYGANFHVGNMSMNSEQQDFGPVMYEDKLYFASTRHAGTSVRRRWVGNHLPFLDVCVAEVNQSTVSDWQILSDKEINKKYHEGPVAFSPDGTEMYITRNNYSGKGYDGVRKLKLLVAKKSGSEWGEPVELQFNSDNFSVGHATLSPDGTTMVFASDMPGGKGGVDLYKTTRSSSAGTWSVPENLSSINTTGDEMFPYIHSGNVLIFASNGHPGYGGLDLFAGHWKNGNVKRFQNMGAPMNSPADDFSVWLDPQMKNGYFASNRKGGKGNDDLYSFSMDKPFSFGRTFRGKAVDQSGIPLSDTRIVFRDHTGAIGEFITGNDGLFEFQTETTGSFMFTGTKDKYFDGSETIVVREESPEELTPVVVLEKDPGFALLAVITDKESKQALDGVKVTLINNMTGTQETVYTNAQGEIFRPIRDKKLNDRISYNIRLEKEGYLSKGTTYNRELNREGKYVVSDETNLSMDKMNVGLDLAKAMDLKPIFFDVNKFNIRSDAAVELDKIVKIMNENPTMVVELGSHTDCRGTAAKNQELSQKRAASSADYIKARISNPNRIYGTGYGESKLINSCGCEGKTKSKCSEAEHQVNRRTEFLIVKI